MKVMRTPARWPGWAIVLCLGSCYGQAQGLAPHVEHREIVDQIDEADLIVVGVVESQRARETVLGPRDIGLLQLFAVSLHVEGVIKGQLNGKLVTFYYYQSANRAWNGPAPNIINPGERGIFYLVRDSGVLRATTDAFLSHTNLESGKHIVSPATDGTLHEAIARLLLLPGERMDVSAYRSSLHRQKALAIALVGPDQVSKTLQEILKNSDGAIRGRVCVTLAEFPLNQKRCLYEIVNDGQVLVEDRKRAAEMLNATPKP